VGRAFRPCLFSGLALGDDCGTEPGAKVFREFVKLGVAINFYGLFCRVADDIAVVAPSQMLFQLGFGWGVDDPVKVVGQFVEKFRALHWLPSPLIVGRDPFGLSRL